MKKLKKLFIFVLCVMSLFLVTGCGSKTAITSDTFKSKVEEMGYTVTDAKSQFESYDYIKEAYVAVDANNSYSVEFYVLSDADYASSFFETNKSKFTTYEGNSKSHVSVDLNNYQKYSVETEANLKYIVRIDNTVFYSETSSSNKDKINTIAKELGYN